MTVPKLLDAQCNHCKSAAGSLSVCAGCKVVKYCCKEHQAADWPTHKAQCTPVKKARVNFEKEETELRNFPGDFTCPANPLEEPEPHFWGWLETRPYMRARYSLLDALRKIKTRDAVQAAHDHVKECLRLCRSDNMGVRDMAPALMLRLGRDQEAYDFMKWYATSGEDPDYDWGDLELPYLDLKGENAFESPAPWTGGFDNFTFRIALTLLKLRLLLDLHSLQNSMKIAEKLPQELVDDIRAHLTGDIVGNNAEIMQKVRDGISIQTHIDAVEAQINTLFNKVNESNKHFWPALVSPGSALTARPGAYSMGSYEEMQLKLQYSYEAWEETPGAIEWVRQKLKS